MLPLKISILFKRIASVYLDISNKYIIPAQRKVGHAMEYNEDTNEEGKLAFNDSLAEKRQELLTQSNDAAKYISMLIDGDQEKSAHTIDERWSSIKSDNQRRCRRMAGLSGSHSINILPCR
ncbi:hypothetical protein BDY19DRAFT_450834 [Irpex rosettiformis]|uniref:Uncharacterized protein n=1 Tax=Irpex rosettiformis TaxID=378272 RepID=A0ACB8TTN5_9APHY|nr:hypothetical protein BDY19DRAFT_450834 [Irpex rosettiformis]